MQERLERERGQLARVEARLREIEEARLRWRREGSGAMRTCAHCGRRVEEPEGRFCPYCGKPLTLDHAYFLPFDKPAREVAGRSVGLFLAALALVAVVAGVVAVIADRWDAPALNPRPLSELPAGQPQLALLSLRYERPRERGDLLFEGEVENVSDAPLTDVVAIVSLYDADPGLITADRAPIERDVLPPGETSPFRVEVDASPSARSYGVIFQHPSGGIIPTRDDRSR